MAAESPGQTLQPTALVHEAYLRLVGEQRFDGRGHFFAAAAEAMRRVLVNHARDRKRRKRGGGRSPGAAGAGGAELRQGRGQFLWQSSKRFFTMSGVPALRGRGWRSDERQITGLTECPTGDGGDVSLEAPSPAQAPAALGP